MNTAVEWFRKECAAIETRASGRVTPSVLAPVRVFLPGNPETGLKLEEVATVGVRDGSMLLITLFEEDVSGKPIRTKRFVVSCFYILAYLCP